MLAAVRPAKQVAGALNRTTDRALAAMAQENRQLRHKMRLNDKEVAEERSSRGIQESAWREQQRDAAKAITNLKHELTAMQGAMKRANRRTRSNSDDDGSLDAAAEHAAVVAAQEATKVLQEGQTRLRSPSLGRSAARDSKSASKPPKPARQSAGGARRRSSVMANQVDALVSTTQHSFDELGGEDADAAQELIHRMKMLLTMTADVSVSLNMTTVMENLADSTTEMLDCERATIYIVDKLRNELRVEVATGGCNPFSMPINEGIAGNVAASGVSVRIDDAYASPHFNSSVDAKMGFRTRSVMCLPVHNSEGEVVCVVQVLGALWAKGGRRYHVLHGFQMGLPAALTFALAWWTFGVAAAIEYLAFTIRAYNLVPPGEG